jgi:glycine cleavage system aminomethyltransferase T
MATHGQPAARSPLDDWHVARGARFTLEDGWKVAASYGSVEQEVAAAKGLALADVSAQARIGFLGNGVPAAALALLADGSLRAARAVARLGPAGPLACRLASDHLLLFAGRTCSAALEESAARLTQMADVRRYDATCVYAVFCLLGAHGTEVLSRLTALDLSPEVLPSAACAETNVAGVHALLIRPPEPPPNAIYVCTSWDLAAYLWQRLLKSGQFAGITPIGMDAYEILASQAG